MKEISFTVPVYCFADFKGPTHIRFVLNKEKIRRIKDLSKIIRDLGLFCTEEYDSNIELLVKSKRKYTAYDGKAEVCFLRVLEESFQFTGTLTTVPFEGTEIAIKKLNVRKN